MFTYFLMIVAALLYVTLGYSLIRNYIRTRNKGYLWLAAAFLLWPFLQNILSFYKMHLLNRFVAWFPDSISAGTFTQDFQLAEFTILPALLLIALYYLGNRKPNGREALT